MIERRTFMAALSGAAAWPLAALAQATLPVIALVSARSADAGKAYAAAFRKGLARSVTSKAGT